MISRTKKTKKVSFEDAIENAKLVVSWKYDLDLKVK